MNKKSKAPNKKNAVSSPAKSIPHRPTLAAFTPVLPQPAKEPVQKHPVKKQAFVHHLVATADQCPLVMDGEVAISAFTPEACSACEEFDCKFCLPDERGSGALKSHLFAQDEPGDEDDNWGNPIDPETDEPTHSDLLSDPDENGEEKDE